MKYENGRGYFIIGQYFSSKMPVASFKQIKQPIQYKWLVFARTYLCVLLCAWEYGYDCFVIHAE